MSEYFTLIWKCFFFYFVIIFALRLMGKREVGELSVFDIVIYLVMSELLALSITEADDSIFKALVPLFTLAFLQILLSQILLRFQKVRDFVDGKPVILIDHGVINQKAMRKERYSIDDLMTQLRDKNIGTPEEVAFAILENSGSLSVLPANCNHMKYPFPLIQDGVMHHEVMDSLEVNEAELLKLCKANGIDKIEDCFICLYQKNGYFMLKKAPSTSKN